MSDIKKVILIICIILILILILFRVLVVLKSDTTNTLDIIEIVDEEEYNPDSIENTLQLVEYRSDFYAVQACVEKFYVYYGQIFEEETQILGAQQAIYNMLDDKYKDYKQITEINIKEKLPKIKNSKVNINEMYVNQKNEDIYVYIVKGRLRDISTKEISDFEVIVEQDIVNQTFTVILDDYVKEYYNDIRLGQELKIEVPENIEINDYNKYDFKIINEETYVTDLIAKYKEEVMYDTESAYNHLDEEYRQKRFSSLEEFQSYVKGKTRQNISLKLSKYNKNNVNGYTEYVCIDKKGNYYIFREKSIMNYGMILDTYTVELPEFIKKYEGSNEEEKVVLNINKIVTAINEKDYRYVYNKLNTTYKNTYFNDFNTFTQMLENNFYTLNDMDITKCESVGQKTYINTLKITNQDNSEETKNIVITVRLLENREFEMSFAIQ